MAFADTLRAVNEMKAEGVVEDYAIAGAMAMVFWTEPVATFDLDVLVRMPSPEGSLVSLDRIYRWARARGYPAQDEHVVIEGLPTQFVPAPDALAQEAIARAPSIDYQGVAARVVRPEHLISFSDMASRSDSDVAVRPVDAVVRQLRKGKAALHQRHSTLPPPEKVRLVMELQRIAFPLLSRRRPLRSWERPWEIEP